VKFELINSTAISVQWQAPLPREQNGIIRGYQIHFVHVGENNERLGTPLMLEVDSSKTDVVVSNLLPDTHYQLQMSAFTRKGEGERTKPKKIKTKGAG